MERIARWRRLLRIRPFETDSPDGRSAERYRRIAWSTILGIVARAVGITVSLITVPLVVGYLGTERYGMWLTISSLIAVLGPLDLGIGNGLLQIVSDASGRDDRAAARRAISTAFVLLSGIALALAAVTLVAYPSVPWARLFNVTSPQAVAEAGPAAVTLILIFAPGLPLSVVGVVQAAYQSGYLTSLWSIAAGVASLLALIVAIGLEAGLPVLIISLAGMSLVAAALNGVVLFRHQRPWLSPRIREFGGRAAASLLRTGLLFIVLQLAGLAAYQLDNFVIAQVMGASAVPQYAIPVKLFALAPTLVSFALTPLWPAYREALAHRDGEWVRRTLSRSIRMALLINVPVSIFLVVFGPAILSAWVGSAVSTTLLLLIGLATWTCLNSVVGPLAMLLNGANAIGFQAVCAVLMAVCNVALSVFLVARIGVAGAIYGSIVAQIVFVLIPSAWFVPRLLARMAPDASPSAVSGT